MRRVLKVLAWLLAGLFGLAFALVAAFVASNWRDAEPQPWPAALTMAPPPAGATLVGGLTAPPGPSLHMNCEDEACQRDPGAAWAARMLQWRQLRSENPAFGAACQAWVEPSQLLLTETVKEPFNAGFEIPSYSSLSRCSSWLLTAALNASARGQADEALALLRQADRLHRGLLNGSRLLIGHLIAQSGLERQLQVIAWVAQRHPALAQALLPLAELPTEVMRAATRRWIASESTFGRNAFRDAAKQGCQEGLSMGCWPAGGYHPERTIQTLAERRLAWLRALDDGGLPALAALDMPIDASWRGLPWRNPGGHMLLAAGEPAWRDYFLRGANLELAAAATTQWLRARASGLAQPADALGGRLSLAEQGTWVLRLWPESDATRRLVPQRWPSPV